MGQDLDWRKVEEARAAFERMKCAEDGVEGVAIRRVVFQHQHPLLDVLQVLLRLVDEFQEQFLVGFEV